MNRPRLVGRALPPLTLSKEELHACCRCTVPVLMAAVHIVPPNVRAGSSLVPPELLTGSADPHSLIRYRLAPRLFPPVLMGERLDEWTRTPFAVKIPCADGVVHAGLSLEDIAYVEALAGGALMPTGPAQRSLSAVELALIHQAHTEVQDDLARLANPIVVAGGRLVTHGHVDSGWFVSLFN